MLNHNYKQMIVAEAEQRSLIHDLSLGQYLSHLAMKSLVLHYLSIRPYIP